MMRRFSGWSLALPATLAVAASGCRDRRSDRRLAPPPACDDDLFAATPDDLSARGIGPLPQSLGAAVDALEASALLRTALGPGLHEQFVCLKRAEHLEHARHVSRWELDRYATRF